MDGTAAGAEAGALVARLLDTVNRHDLEGLTACFAADYRNETPAHPARGFEGRAQVRHNWEQVFAAVPDLSADARWLANDGTAWSEWEMRGTRRDGQPHLLRGVVIFEVADSEVTAARFYLEPVESGGPGIDGTIRRTLRLEVEP